MSALAFDLDGTLVSCRERQVAVAQSVAGDLDADRFWAAKQAGRTTREALEEQGLEGADAAALAWAERVEDESFLALDRQLPRAAEALAAAREAGHAPVLLTARRDSAAVRRQAERVGLLARAEGLVVVLPRRAAESKAAALREMAAVGMVGDTESDARAADLAGVPFAAVAGGQRSAAFLREHGIREVHPDALAAVLALLQLSP